MNDLSFLVTFEAIVFGLNCIISTVLYMTNRTLIFKYLLILWLAITLQFVAFGTAIFFTSSLVFEAIFENGFMLLFINVIFLKILYLVNNSVFKSKHYLIFNSSAITLAIVFALQGHDFVTVASMIVFPNCLSSIYLTVRLHLQRSEKSILISSFSLLYILGLLHDLNYPFLRTVEWFAPYGFTIHAAIYVGFAILLPCILIQKNLEKHHEELKKNEEKFRELIESSTDIIWEVDCKGAYTYISPQIECLLGFKPGEVIGKTPFDLMQPDVSDKIAKEFSWLVRNGIPFSHKENIYISSTGENLVFETNGTPIKDSDGVVTGFRGIDRDITVKKQLQEQVNQSSKMDAIGQISGGIAHDFNNILTGIMAAASLLNANEKEPLNDKQLKYVDIILKASSRAADLTAKLLAFGRKGKISSSVICVHKIIDDNLEIFYGTIDKKIKISTTKNAAISTVIGDISAIQNAILNLGINSSDAMPDGGKITISTKNVEFDKAYCETSQFKLSPGTFLEIEFRDTGHGISAENQKKIFEPFFTTKSVGKGTGLGLASVYGTICDHNGAIFISSAEGVGTTFYLYIPCTNKKQTNKTRDDAIEPGTGLILFVDDEDILLQTGEQILKKMGYDVLIAENGLEAVDIYNKNHQKIDLVIMDMIMPEMNGREAFLKMQEINQNCKVLIASGFTEDSQLTALGISGFIHKPYSEAKLSQFISELLNH